jgi:hypothetical protein
MDHVARPEPSGSSWQNDKSVAAKQQGLEQLEHTSRGEIQDSEDVGAQNVALVM